MPTENRSSNTEMVSVPRADIEALLREADHMSGYTTASNYEEVAGCIRHMRAFLDKPAPQPHPEPIAWMVGTAIWWTKEEAERDAAETGLPIVGLGPMTGTGTIEQHQGEPLPITRDMNRLMEACRIGEFKDEGGSETVEALAVASLDAKSSMGHDADSYMAGYSAALYEQVEPFIWMSLSSQFQRDPVAWRGINELGEVVTEWIDGSPPPSMVDLCGKPASFAKIELAYTNADPAEVERLRRFEAAYLEWSNKTDWVQQTAAPKELGMHRADVIKQRFDTLRAQLAERDALLRMQDSLLEEAYQYDIGTPLKRKIRAVALSASAEPSAPAPMPAYMEAACDKFDWTPEEALRFYAEGKHFDIDRGRTRILCTGAIASHALKGMGGEYADMKGIEPSAPVEIDCDALVAAVCVLRSQGLGNLSEAVEAARLALELQPS